MAEVGGYPAVRTYRRRGSRITPGQADARDRLADRYGFPVDGRPLDLAVLFGRTAPVVLEIGFGMGEATTAMALAQPATDVLAVDVHAPGHGALLRDVERHGLTNVRVGDGDALVVLDRMLAPAALAGIRLFFPDPWPKRRHEKRRLVGPRFADLAASRLRPGGVLHVATDSRPYADAVVRVVANHPALERTDRAPWRAPTRFEGQARAAGRPSYDVAAVRVARAAQPVGRVRFQPEQAYPGGLVKQPPSHSRNL